MTTLNKNQLQGAFDALQSIDKIVCKNQNLLEDYYSKLSEYDKKRNKGLLKKLKESEKFLDENLKLNKKLEPFREVIINVLKTTNLLLHKSDMDEDIMDAMADKLELKDKIIKELKSHIEDLHNSMSEHNIPIPEFKQIVLKSSVKTDDAFERRLNIISNSQDDEESEIHKWLSSLNIDRSKEIIRKIPNKVLEQEGDRQGIKIKTKSTESNKVFIKPNNS